MEGLYRDAGQAGASECVWELEKVSRNYAEWWSANRFERLTAEDADFNAHG
jgi:hypothetical protein